VHPDISKEAMLDIAKWLKRVCNEPDLPELPMPGNINAALKLRLTAHTLGMERYVKHFETYYAVNVVFNDRNIHEIIDVVDCARGVDLAMLSALANLLSYVCRDHWVSEAVDVGYAEFLVDEKFGRLLAAVNEEDVKAMGRMHLIACIARHVWSMRNRKH
jgi:hypothetical protein